MFLGEDNSVKLGDFGLSKVMQSHDFASTYVGTPFYMSPEICAAEKYTLKSDIWSLGCIIYELCTREPPFNAKSHYQLVQKIKEGKIATLPPVYSAELFAVIKDCLRVNPDRRPDTATLLNLPVVRLMRKEKEVVEFSKLLRTKEEALSKRIRELDQKFASMEYDKAAVRQEIDAQVRREWEVKARLEIDRLVAREIEDLKRKFEIEVQARVEAELAQRKAVTFSEDAPLDLSSSVAKSDYPQSSIGSGSIDGEFPSTTDITELSVDSPDTSLQAVKKNTRTPFARAQTMFVSIPQGTPMDVEMASPSPITISSLSLSPRRNAGAKVPAPHPTNIFTAANRMNETATDTTQWDTSRNTPSLGSDSESDEEVQIPSPTRMIRSSKNPFTSKQRPTLHAQMSAPLQRMQSKQTLVPQAKTQGAIPSASSSTDLPSIRKVGSNGALRERSDSPNRRLSKIPSAANLKADGSAGPVLNRKTSFTSKKDEQSGQLPSLSKVGNKTGIRGRTLVELTQARAGGRPLSAVVGENVNVSPTRAFREHAAAVNRKGIASEPAAVWDPERDEMPSPFLVRQKKIL